MKDDTTKVFQAIVGAALGAILALTFSMHKMIREIHAPFSNATTTQVSPMTDPTLSRLEKVQP